MAGPELPNSSLTDSRYFTMNEIRMLCSALRHMDAVWRLGGRECLPGAFFQWLLRSRVTPALFGRERLPLLRKVLL